MGNVIKTAKKVKARLRVMGKSSASFEEVGCEAHTAD
jgi:hypothetical protein